MEDKKEKVKIKEKFAVAEDYDFFIFEVPLTHIFHRYVKQYLYVTLGNNYPGFSEKSCFDYCVGIYHKKIVAYVVVMERFVLNEYLKSNGNKGIRISEKKNRVFFKKTKNFLFFAILIPLLAVLFASLFNGKKYQKISEEIPLEITTVERNEIEYESFVSRMFEILRESEGHINHLIWKFDGVNEILEGNINGMYPEFRFSDGVEIKYSSISYKNSFPEFNVNFVKKRESLVIPVKKSIENGAEFGNEHYRNAVRNLIKEKNCQLITESYSPWLLQYLCLEEKLESMLEEMEIILKENNLALNLLKLNKDANNQYQMEIGLIKKENLIIQPEKLLLAIKNNLDCFGSESKQSEKNLVAKNKIAEEKEIKKIEKEDLKLEVEENVISDSEKDFQKNDFFLKTKGLKKIGAVRHGDGNVIAFYKDEKGKIFKRSE